MRSFLARIPLSSRIAAGYAVVACGWIVWADGAILRYLGNLNRERWKGFLFVAVTALLVRTLIERLWMPLVAAKEALRVSDERWKFALEGADDGVWDWNGETRKVFFSPRWKAMLGYAEGEIGDTAAEWESRIHPDDRALMRRNFRLHYLGKTPAFECEHRLRAKDKTYKWVLARGKAICRTSDGRPSRVIGTQSDITARKETEARIVDALHFNETILRTVPVGITTYRADGQTISANETATSFVGAESSVVLQQNFRQLESWQRHGLVELADQALNENRVVTHSARIMSSFGRERWGELRFVPFLYEREQRLMLIVRDTTEQQAATMRLELLHAALQAAPTGWVVTDAQGVIEWVNPGFTALTGYASEEAVGQTPKFLKSGRHGPAFYADFWQTIKAGRVWRGELCNRHKNGSLYYERTTVAPVRDALGVVTHFVAMKEDITGQRDLEQRLVRSQRLESIGLLASGIAHDLNNILAPIALAISLLKERHDDPQSHELLDMMRGNAKRGADIVRQVLTFARGVDSERVQLDVRPLLKEIAQLARETFPREIRIVADVAPGAWLVEGDVTSLHQVLLNLSLNARDAMPDGGVLTLKAEVAMLDAAGMSPAAGCKPGKYVKLVVADTGTGISPEVLDHIFEPFFTTKPRGRGTGLGLSTVYGIVRSLGGFVDVRSTEGTGTEFGVFLPAATAPARVGPSHTAAAEPVAGAGRRILVVDDEVSIRRVISRVLERRGFISVEAGDGMQGLDKLRDEPGRFSAAIVDLMMPGINGYQLIGKIRRVAPTLPIVVVTGMMGQAEAGEDRAALIALGVQAVLKKPFDESELLAALSF